VPELSNAGSRNLGLRFAPPAFLLGALAAAMQILLLREFAAHFPASELTLGFVLAGWLFWGAIGSAAASRFRPAEAALPRLLAAVPVLAAAAFLALRGARFALGLQPGELTGAGTAALFAFGLTAAVSLPLGAAFVLAARREGSASRVYLWEAAGAAAGGIATAAALVPWMSNGRALAVAGAAAAAGLHAAFSGRRKRAAAIVVLAMLAFALVDGPSLRLYWRPFELVRTSDGLYGRISVLRTEEQINLYADGFRLYSCPDRSGAEEAVHFALLQRGGARRVLLIGGGIGGGLGEILKYPGVEVDYVELDPEVLRLSEEFLPAPERAALRDVRVRTHLGDGRAFLESSRAVYDAVLLDLPEPATAPVNRFYTVEFFRSAAAHLAEGGVLSFRVPAAENYIGPELAAFLATMRATLAAAFPETAVVPGDTAVFLASTAPLTLDPGILDGRMADIGLRVTYTQPAQIAARLHPLRREALARALASGRAEINTDFRPVSYYFQSVLWSSAFRGGAARILAALGSLPRPWLLVLPLALVVLLLAAPVLRPRAPARILSAAALMGLTTMSAELLVLIRFQTLYGVVYGRLAPLLAAFMIGLAAGAFRGERRSRRGAAALIGLQATLLGLVLVLGFTLAVRPPAAAFPSALFLLGFLGGDFFIVAAALVPAAAARPGSVYAADLAGSCVGAVALSAILLPLAGLPALFAGLSVLNAAGLLALVVGRKRL